jgi:hypothetical protein
MRFKPISLPCDCGRCLPARIRQVGLTPQHELVIKWRCACCKRTHYTVKSLADYWRECPNPLDALVAPKAATDEMREPDAQFLHSLGVRLPNGE